MIDGLMLQNAGTFLDKSRKNGAEPEFHPVGVQIAQFSV
jgi:hypothetical protein